MSLRLSVMFFACLFVASAFLTKSLKRKSKEKSGWSENWESWSDDETDSCSCDCKKKQETVAIVIPKYQFVDIPTAKEVHHEEVVTPQKVHVSGFSDQQHEDFDEDEEHNHRILDGNDWKRQSSPSVRSH